MSTSEFYNKEIGKGGFGVVWKALQKNDHQEVECFIILFLILRCSPPAPPKGCHKILCGRSAKCRSRATHHVWMQLLKYCSASNNARNSLLWVWFSQRYHVSHWNFGHGITMQDTGAGIWAIRAVRRLLKCHITTRNGSCSSGDRAAIQAPFKMHYSPWH